VPNLACTFGYINASWTLRADLTAEYVCRLLTHLDETGMRQVTPRLRDTDRNMPARPWIDQFSSGYMQRMMHRFPKQGDRVPWINPQNYARDRKMLRRGTLEDGALLFSNPRSRPTTAAPPRGHRQRSSVGPPNSGLSPQPEPVSAPPPPPSDA
jgi:monooxygenase